MGLFDNYDGNMGSMGGMEDMQNPNPGLLSQIGDHLQDPRNKAGLLAFAQALIQAGAPRPGGASKGAWIGGLGSAMGEMTKGQLAYDQQQQAKEFKKLQMEHLKAQNAELSSRHLGDKLVAEQKQQVQSLMAGNPALTAGAQAGDVGPTATNAARIAQTPADAYNQRASILENVGLIEPAMKLRKEARDLRDKLEITPSGEVWNPFAPTAGKNYGKVEYTDFGGYKAPINPAGKFVGEAINKTQSPDSVASNQLGWANNALARENQNMPVIQSGPNGEMFSIDRRRGIGAPVLDQSGNPLNKGEKALTEYQGKSTGFGLRATEADKILSGLGTEGVIPSNIKQSLGNMPLMGGVAGAMANAIISPIAQKREQAERDFVNAVLRQESGAAINQSEFDNAKRQYFPRAGDSQAVIEQKAKNRETAIKAFAISAGPGAKHISTGGQKFVDGQVYTDANGNKATYKNGQWVQ